MTAPGQIRIRAQRHSHTDRRMGWRKMRKITPPGAGDLLRRHICGSRRIGLLWPGYGGPFSSIRWLRRSYFARRESGRIAIQPPPAHPFVGKLQDAKETWLANPQTGLLGGDRGLQ